MEKKKVGQDSPSPPATRERRWTRPSPRLRRISARAPLCAWATSPRCRWMPFPPALSGPGRGSGIGGVPKGRIIEIYGPESSGKDHPGPPYRGPGPEEGRRGGLRGRRARPGPGLCRGPSAWTSTICWSPSPTPASRHWKSPTPWSAPAPWTWWWWTPSPP